MRFQIKPAGVLRKKDFDQFAIDRFFKKVEKGVGDECWTWKAGCDGKGYGVFSFMLKAVFAHRVAYCLSRGCAPEGLFVCHKCDNPKCVNPNHLFIGSNKENQGDKVAKMRHCRGESHGMSKINEETVIKIRQFYTFGVSAENIAKHFKISRSVAFLAAIGHTWKSVPGACKKPGRGSRKNGKTVDEFFHKFRPATVHPDA